MPKLNPTAVRALKIALVCSVPFLFLAGAVAPEDIGDLLDLLAVFAGLGAGVLHLGRPPANLREAVQESVELAEQAILGHDEPEADTAADQAVYQPKHAAEQPQIPEAAIRAHQAAQEATAQLAGVVTGIATALVDAFRQARPRK